MEVDAEDGEPGVGGRGRKLRFEVLLVADIGGRSSGKRCNAVTKI